MNIKELKPLDYIILAAIVAVIAFGLLIVMEKNKFSKSPVEATKKIAFQVMLKSVSVTDNKMPFIVGEESFITFVVSLIDEAKITKDGPVVGGNKIKIGLPIVLEGFNYRIGGTISNVQVLEDKDIEAINKYVDQQKTQQKILELQSQGEQKAEAKGESKEAVKK